MDNMTSETRSRIMSKVRSQGNRSTELELIQLFKKNEIKGWRRGVRLEGKPDFIFSKNHLIVFADGCFWHGHNCRNLKPKDNSEYWAEKIKENKRRDKRVKKELETKGWRVFRIWECDIKKGKLPKGFIEMF